MEQTFVIPGRLASLNDYVSKCRTNAYVGAKFKAEQEAIVSGAIMAAGLSRMEKRVDVRIKWCEPNMRRDHDNVASARKYILDALVSCGVLKDDGWPYVGNFEDSFFHAPKNPRIEVTLLEVEQ